MAVQRASALLQEMKDGDASGNHECRPNSITYNSIIKCIARSRHADKAFRASKVVVEMEERNIPPDITSFNSVLMACAFSSTHDLSSRTKAFEIALQMFQRAHNEAKPTRDTFCFLFQAAYGMGEDKEVEAAYHLCCRTGFQNDTLVRRDLKKTAPHLLNP
jgi:pentatricopeptide repeat protein